MEISPGFSISLLHLPAVNNAECLSYIKLNRRFTTNIQAHDTCDLELSFK